jgi:hypothetical protein
MGFQRKVPSSVVELKGYLEQVHQNRKHVSGVKVNPANGHLEIDLDRMANFAGHPDMYMPLKKGRNEAAKIFVERLMTQSAAGFAPSDRDAQELFDMIDPQGS